eukprot:m.120352 g.120352  ORF g.120352 m.120352 type:complete len:88 (+) comp15493_c2_seq2:108-371(+)
MLVVNLKSFQLEFFFFRLLLQWRLLRVVMELGDSGAVVFRRRRDKLNLFFLLDDGESQLSDSNSALGVIFTPESGAARLLVIGGDGV